TGLSTDRGDQLIVDSLPFEAMLRDEPPSAVPGAGLNPSNKPVDFEEEGTKNWNWILIALVGFGGDDNVARSLTKRSHKQVAEVTAQRALAEPESVLEMEIPKPGYVPALENAATKAAADIVDRVRLLTEKDLNTATLVLRSWLHESKAK